MCMPRTIAAFAAAAAVLVAAAPAASAREPRSLGVKPFTLTSDTKARKVNVGVDKNGTGHFVWDVSINGGADPVHYCRVPRGARACQNQQDIPLPLEAFGEPQVIVPTGGIQVVLVTYRCCGPGEGTYAIVSTDGGNTFGTPHVIGTIGPGQAALWPGTQALALADDVVTAGIHFQAAPIAGPAADHSANVGDGPSQGYDGTIGFPTSSRPLVAFDDLENAFFREWTGAGDPNLLGTWGPAKQIGALTEVRIGTGKAGVVLMGKKRIQNPFSAVYVARRYDVATDTFGPAKSLSRRKLEPDVIFRDIFEDDGGHVAAIWISNGIHSGRVDPMRYRASGDGGKTWKAERTLVKATKDQAFNLQMGAAPDGGGFAAWDDNDRGPLKAVPIPKYSKQ